MKTLSDPPFYVGEVVWGTVIKLCYRYALLDVRGCKMRLEKHLISWGAVGETLAMLETGQRIEVMVMADDCKFGMKRQERPSYSSIPAGFWLSRLPLMNNPWPTLEVRYPDGSFVEVELVGYDRKTNAIVKFPEGVMAKVPMIGLFRYAKNNHRLPKKPLPGERLKVIVRGKLAGDYWLQPFYGLSKQDNLALSGYRYSMITTPALRD